MMVSDNLMLRVFHSRSLCGSQMPENIENVPSAQAAFIEQVALSRYCSSV